MAWLYGWQRECDINNKDIKTVDKWYLVAVGFKNLMQIWLFINNCHNKHIKLKERRRKNVKYNGYYILVKPKKLYHVYNINKYEKCGDDKNKYNSIPICYTTNAYLEGNIHNPKLVKIENIKNIIINIYNGKYNNFCGNCANKVFIESPSKLLKSKIKQESANYDNKVFFSVEEYDYILKFIRENLQTE